jgi:hypothetical protein
MKSKGILSHLIQTRDELSMLIGDVFLYERCCFEQFLADFAPEFAFVFLFDERFNHLGQFPSEASKTRRCLKMGLLTRRNFSRHSPEDPHHLD